LEAVEQLGLGVEVLVLGAHVAEFLVGVLGFAVYGASATFEPVRRFFAGSDGLEGVANCVAVRSILGDGGGELRKEGRGCAEDVL
jgi:hypothetical protein